MARDDLTSIRWIVSFRGRASRMEFWLVVSVIAAYETLVMLAFGQHFKVPDANDSFPLLGVTGIILWVLPVLPLLATIERRANDTGYSSKLLVGVLFLGYSAAIFADVLLATRSDTDFDLLQHLRGPSGSLPKIAGIVVFLVVLATLSLRSEPSTNEHGPPPSAGPSA